MLFHFVYFYFLFVICYLLFFYFFCIYVKASLYCIEWYILIAASHWRGSKRKKIYRRSAVKRYHSYCQDSFHFFNAMHEAVKIMEHAFCVVENKFVLEKKMKGFYICVLVFYIAHCIP